MDRPVNERRIRAGLNRAYRSIALQECLVPGCESTGGVIKAHSIQERHVLERISVDGHVYMIPNNDEGVVFDRIGIHRATRFTGFCRQHDNALFQSIDLGGQQDIDIHSIEDLARLSLRAVACEYWKKRNIQKMTARMLEYARKGDLAGLCSFVNADESDAHDFMENLKWMAKHMLDGLEKSIQRIGGQFESLYSQIQNNKYHLSKSCVITLEVEPQIVAAAHFPPEYDLSGAVISRRERGVEFPEVTMNILPAAQGVHAIFLWHRKYDKSLRGFFDELKSLGDEQKALVLSQMVIIQCENVAYSPRLVEGWRLSDKENVLDLFKATLNRAVPYSDNWSIDLFGVCK